MVHRIAQSTYHKHKYFWNRERIISLIWTFLIFGIALTFQKFADEYVIETGGTVVGDILLNNIPALDIDGLIISSTLIFTFVTILLGLAKPEYILFSLKSVALFVTIRAFFITLTHLGIHPDQIVLADHNIGFFLYDILYNTKNDFFFSGHTGIPFLMFLIYYREPFWRHIFLATSCLFGAFVLIGHMHYSIDVFAAPFMTYSIFSIARVIFARDFSLLTPSTKE
jgi:hypothetical protein